MDKLTQILIICQDNSYLYLLPLNIELEHQNKKKSTNSEVRWQRRDWTKTTLGNNVVFFSLNEFSSVDCHRDLLRYRLEWKLDAIEIVVWYITMSTDIFVCIHLSAGRVQGLVALQLLARGVRASALSAVEGPAWTQRRSGPVLLLLQGLALRPSAGQRADCGFENYLSRSLKHTPRVFGC